MSPIKYFVISILFIGINTCVLSQSKENASNSNKEINILFVGNSLTYTNNLPKLVKEMAKENGVFVKYNMLAYPNYGLIDHWHAGKMQKLIKSKKYDLVIIQQGPSSQQEGKEMLINYGKKIHKICLKNNTKLGYFMVWPSIQYYKTFNGVIENYTDAAKNHGDILFPVGEVWKAHFDSTNNLDYYGTDGFHPSLKGSQIAAKVIVNYLF